VTLNHLTKKILFTLGFLALYRIGVHVPIPGVNSEALAEFFRSQGANLFGMFNMFSGGALERFSIFALGVMPYISASIIAQLLTVIVPHLEALSKEGEAGRKKITQYTRYGTIVIALVQGFMIAKTLATSSAGTGSFVTDPSTSWAVMTTISLTAGTAFVMWLGEQITERGVGNGISLIIFCGIRHRWCGVHGAGSASGSGSVRKTSSRQSGIRWTDFASAHPNQHCGCDSPDFCQLASADSSYGGSVRQNRILRKRRGNGFDPRRVAL
jgi:preprotein translocase subunit SecY